MKVSFYQSLAQIFILDSGSHVHKKRPVCNPFWNVPFVGTLLPQKAILVGNLVQNCQNIAQYNATRNKFILIFGLWLLQIILNF